MSEKDPKEILISLLKSTLGDHLDRVEKKIIKDNKSIAQIHVKKNASFANIDTLSKAFSSSIHNFSTIFPFLYSI